MSLFLAHYFNLWYHTPVAQGLERQSYKLDVDGSIPSWRTILRNIIKHLTFHENCAKLLVHWQRNFAPNFSSTGTTTRMKVGDLIRFRANFAPHPREWSPPVLVIGYDDWEPDQVGDTLWTVLLEGEPFVIDLENFDIQPL